MISRFLFFVATVVATHPAGNPGARTMSVEESLSGSVRPERIALYWDASSNLTKVRPAVPAATYRIPVSDDADITYGTSVSRNEFGIGSGVFPSPSGNLLAVYRKDESAVTDYPLYDIKSRTGEVRMIKYPMNGMASEKLDVCICDYDGNVLNTLKIDDFDEERYLTNVSWSPDGKYVFVQVVDRPQHNMRLNMYRAVDGSFVRNILSESNDAWIEPLKPVVFLKDSYNFIYDTDNRSGYRTLYLCDTLGRMQRLTPCQADVSYVADDGKWVYYTSAEVSPVEQHLFRIRVAGKTVGDLSVGRPQRLTPERGWHQIDMSPDCSKFIDRYSEMNTPGVVQVRSSGGRLLEKILTAVNPIAQYAEVEVELGTTLSADGSFENYYRLVKPRGFDPSKKYPLIVYVYGGPHTQLVNDSWLGNMRMWEFVMAQRGYAVYVQDNRGTPNRGAAFEKAINRRCGQVEMADQMSGILNLLDRSPWIDRDRIGVHGWSYGGFMTLTMATSHPSFFKVAVAGGPVIDWNWYEIMYGERYMDTAETNPEGFAKTSLLDKAASLKARTLICQGVIDTVVVWQHSLSFVQECVKAGVPLDYFPYPVDEHNMVNEARLHLYEKITDYFQSWL